jgi:N-acetylmuramoyl-L-alanine amidase
MSIKIGLDAGHGLYTAGKQTPTNIKEWTLNDNVRDKVVDILSDYECEIIHLDSNEGKVDESLTERFKRYQTAKVDAFVSIHHNAFTGSWNNATGVEVYTDKNSTAADNKLAEAIYSKLVNYTGLKGRGIKQANWYVINQNNIPAVLVEGGFMDSNTDYTIITSDAGQTAYAKAVAEGLIEFLNLKKKINKVTESSEKNSIKYFKKYTGNTSSITDALKAVGAESSFTYRKNIAKINNITNYTGTATQNSSMLRLLKNGILIKP